jgi:hypothetical protein
MPQAYHEDYIILHRAWVGHLNVRLSLSDSITTQEK